ncbi:Tyrosine-specific transport protein [Heracleum sosnowskyi]|uniref:Tyrosine-specific transport protein n=1 Tax=Heracleum sosnowskyi TaxID=360622 RepID=A0AAD8J2G6_9APIA|nr:Tyrosine-specific transport protein [Heracleum sosnowskyi]
MQGGISNGEIITMRIAFKPTSTIGYIPSSLHSHPKNHINSKKISDSLAICYVQNVKDQSSFRIACVDSYVYCGLRRQKSTRSLKVCAVQPRKKCKCLAQLKEETPYGSSKKGTIAGAVALIIGTSIGSGILTLPKKTSLAGIIPSTISITVCWAFLLIEALLLVEVNVGLLKKKEKSVEENELEVISIRTMAEESLGEWGGSLATVTYVFLGYTSMIAYSSKSGEILYHLLNIPESASAILFTAIFSTLITVGGTRTTDQVNQWLTVTMIGLLAWIEVLVVVFGGWSGFEGNGDWTKVPSTIPVMIFSLVYHDLVPVLCAYLEGDVRRIRASLLLGSVVPLLACLVWNAIALGLSSQAQQFADPVELLMRVRWPGVSVMVEAFSLLAIGTSIIGTLLSFSQFYKEQLSMLSKSSPSKLTLQEASKQLWLKNWWGKNKANVTATSMVVAPTLLVSTTVPDACSAATDIAGGYCMTILYGILPPAMAYVMYQRQNDNTGNKTAMSRAGLGLWGLGLFACSIVLEQILQDLS